jgi:hypothetical protein
MGVHCQFLIFGARARGSSDTSIKEPNIVKTKWAVEEERERFVRGAGKELFDVYLKDNALNRIWQRLVENHSCESCIFQQSMVLGCLRWCIRGLGPENPDRCAQGLRLMGCLMNVPL